jgi:hypothetical protein
MSYQTVILDSSTITKTVTLSNGNLTAQLVGATASPYSSIKGSVGRSSGKYYWEVTINSFTSDMTALTIGIHNSNPFLTGYSSTNLRAYRQIGYKYPEGVTYGASYTTNDTISVLLDLDNGKLEFWKNGVSQGISHTDIKTLGTVYPFFEFDTTNTAYNVTVTANFGATAFRYTLPNGYQPYNWSNDYKNLIKNNGQYLSFNGTDFYPVPTSNPTESDYMSSGINDLSVIPQTKWQTLLGDVEVSQWTNDPNITNREFEIETNQFSLANELGNTPKVIYYTDDPTLTPVLTTGIEVTTLAEELGDNPDLLYYTDDPNKTTANMEITANYTPIDELNGDFDVVTWTDEVQSDYNEIKTPTYSQASTGGDLYTTSIDLTKGTGGVKAIQ